MATGRIGKSPQHGELCSKLDTEMRLGPERQVLSSERLGRVSTGGKEPLKEEIKTPGKTAIQGKNEPLNAYQLPSCFPYTLHTLSMFNSLNLSVAYSLQSTCCSL